MVAVCSESAARNQRTGRRLLRGVRRNMMWTRHELRRASYIDYAPHWLDESEATEWFAWCVEHLAWEQRAIVAGGKEVMQPRLMAWAGDLPYRYSGQTLEPRPLEGRLLSLCERASDAAGEAFNHVVINRYRNGRDHIGMHSDAEFELGKDPVIASLSLGCERTFVIQPKDKRGRKQSKRFPLEHGSMLIMGGSFQHRWRHAVPKSGTGDERLNITFRRLHGPPGWRWWDAATEK